MGGVALHPAIEHMAEKGYERGTMDEMAIVNLMRQSLNDSWANHKLLKLWLQEMNPLGLKGPALTDWATEISEWILPTQMRTYHAATTGIEQASDKEQHQEGDGSRQASEASGGHSFTRGGKDEIPFVTQAGQ